MLIIKGYYYFFAAFIYSLVALSDAFFFLKHLHSYRPFRAKLPERDHTILPQLGIGKM